MAIADTDRNKELIRRWIAFANAGFAGRFDRFIAADYIGHAGAAAMDRAVANYQANRLVCEAADLAIQVHGGIGYTRHKPFEHIYRHHRRYRITEGSEEIQIRRVAQRLFGVDVKRAVGDPAVVGR